MDFEFQFTLQRSGSKMSDNQCFARAFPLPASVILNPLILYNNVWSFLKFGNQIHLRCIYFREFRIGDVSRTNISADIRFVRRVSGRISQTNDLVYLSRSGQRSHICLCLLWVKFANCGGDLSLSHFYWLRFWRQTVLPVQWNLNSCFVTTSDHLRIKTIFPAVPHLH